MCSEKGTSGNGGDIVDLNPILRRKKADIADSKITENPPDSVLIELLYEKYIKNDTTLYPRFNKFLSGLNDEAVIKILNIIPDSRAPKGRKFNEEDFDVDEADNMDETGEQDQDIVDALNFILDLITEKTGRDKETIKKDAITAWKLETFGIIEKMIAERRPDVGKPPTNIVPMRPTKNSKK